MQFYLFLNISTFTDLFFLRVFFLLCEVDRTDIIVKKYDLHFFCVHICITCVYVLLQYVFEFILGVIISYKNKNRKTCTNL